MRSRLILLLVLVNTVALAQNGPNQINPATQIRWPISCTGPNGYGVYNPLTNSCGNLFITAPGATVPPGLNPPTGAALMILTSNGAPPAVQYIYTGGASVTDKRIWTTGNTSDGAFHLSATSDDYTSSGGDAMTCTRVGAVPDYCTFPGLSTPKIKDKLASTGALNEVPTAQGDGTWKWGPGGGGGTGCTNCVLRTGDTMTGPLIVNTPSGPPSTFSGGVGTPKLFDSANNSGASSQVPVANGDGTWNWGAGGSGGGGTPPPATTLVTGTTGTLAGPREYFVCTGTCTVTPPVPSAGFEFCVFNDDAVNTKITMGAIGSGARYEKTDRSAYGTAGTGTMVSGGAVADKVCLTGLDATHYVTSASNGTWTVN